MRAGQSWVRVKAMARYFSRLQNVQTGSGAHLISYAVDTRVFFPRVKRPRRDCDHFLPISLEVKNWWSYTFTHSVTALFFCY